MQKSPKNPRNAWLRVKAIGCNKKLSAPIMDGRPPSFIRHPFPSSERGIFVMFIKYSDPTTDDRLKLEEGASTNKLKVDMLVGEV